MKRLLAAGSICVFLFLGVIGCGGESMAGYQKIPAAEAKNMMDKGGVTVVDVRREEEYKTGHIPEAVLLTNETIGNEPDYLSNSLQMPRGESYFYGWPGWQHERKLPA